MTTLTELLASHPLAVEAIDLQSVHNKYTIATKVRDYANVSGVGDFAFDSIETLLDLIESKLKADRGLSDEEIEAMKWRPTPYMPHGDTVRGVGIDGGFFNAKSTRCRDMAIAAEIIALLREHPVCCERLSVHMEHANIEPATDARVAITGGRVTLYGDDDRADTTVFREWLTGACVEWCIANGVMLPEQCFAEWDIHDADGNTTRYPTFLHALLAAIERHEETT